MGDLLDKINNSGRLHMVPAIAKGEFVIRFALCSENACQQDIDVAWNIIQDTAKDLVRPKDIVGRSPSTLPDDLIKDDNVRRLPSIPADNSINDIVRRLPSTLPDNLIKDYINERLPSIPAVNSIKDDFARRSPSIPVDNRTNLAVMSLNFCYNPKLRI